MDIQTVVKAYLGELVLAAEVEDHGVSAHHQQNAVFMLDVYASRHNLTRMEAVTEIKRKYTH